jgi:uncharacterized protein
MIERAESALRRLGFHDVRVRHHELRRALGPGTTVEALARIEVGPGEMGELLRNGLPAQIAGELHALGYGHVTLDLAGYRRGSLNTVLERPPAAQAV